MGVLIISNSDNEHANQVSNVISNGGIPTMRLDLNKVVEERNKLFISSRKSLLLDGKQLSPQEITGVFIHHPKVAIPDGSALDDLDREIVIASWKNALDWLEAVLSNAIWINKLSASRNAASPLMQICAARNTGLMTPASCYTNDVNLLRTFAKSHERIVLKSGPVALSKSKKRILSHIIDPWSIEENQLIGAPCFFQEYVEKAFELRVHVVDQKIYTCKIESQANESTRVDWRNYDIPKTPHYPFELDEVTENRCVELIRNFGLTVGIIDLIARPDGQLVFLECNSQGHWIWIEELTGLPITKEICNLLTEGSRSF